MNKNKGEVLIRKLVVFLVITFIVGLSGCLGPNSADLEQSGINKSQGIVDNANRLLGDYKWKLELITEIQKRTDALGTAATKEMYTEWKFRNREAIDSGERLATYITEHRDVLDQYWTSDVLVLIATNKVTFERDNQALERIINSHEQQAKRYRWWIDYYGREGSRDLGILRFENMGKNLSGVKFRFEFYKSSGALYSTESLDVGDVASGEIVRRKVSLPGRYLGEETWNEKKIFVSVNGVWEEQQY